MRLIKHIKTPENQYFFVNLKEVLYLHILKHQNIIKYCFLKLLFHNS